MLTQSLLYYLYINYIHVHTTSFTEREIHTRITEECSRNWETAEFLA